MKFFGQWNCTIDEKGRVIIPQRLRKELDDEVIVTLGSDGFLRIYLLTEAKNLTPSQIWFVRLDKQGRVMIPKRLKVQSQKMVWYGEGNYLKLRPR